MPFWKNRKPAGIEPPLQAVTPTGDDGEPLFLSEQDIAEIEEYSDSADPTTDENRALMHRWRDERIQPALDHWNESWFPKVRQAYKYYEGDTFFKINPVDGSLHFEEGYDNQNVPSNHFSTLINAIVSRILQDRPVPSVVPGSAGERDDNKTVAKLANLVMRHVENVNQGEIKDQILALHAVLGGVAWQVPRYDASQTGKANTENGVEDAATGEIVYDIVSALNVLMQPTTAYDHCNWHVYYEDYPLSYVANEWERGQYVKPSSAEMRDIWLGTEQGMKGVPAPKDLGEAEDKTSTLVRVFRCYERRIDDDGLQTWFRMTFCEDTLLEDAVPIGADLELIPYWFNQSLFENAGTTLAWDLIPLQEQINRAVGVLVTRADLHGTVNPLIPEGAAFPDGFFDNSHDPKVCPVSANGQMITPEWMIPPPIDSQGMVGYIGFLKAEMDDIAGIHETSRGIYDKGINSGKQAQIAAMQDNTNLQRAMAHYRTAKQTFWTQCLRLAADNYPDGKVFEVVGKDGMLQSDVFRKTDFTNPGVVEMRTISRIPLEPQAKMDFILSLNQAGFFDKPPEIQARLFSMLEFDTTPDEEVAWREKARKAALKQVEMIRDGKPVEVFVYQDIDLLMEMLLREVNTVDFLGYQPNIKALFKQQIDMCKALQAQQMMEMQQQAMALQPPAMPGEAQQQPPQQPAA